MKYGCPICKHDEVRYEDGNPVTITTKIDIREYYVSICENCNNIYCYKVEIVDRVYGEGKIE